MLKGKKNFSRSSGIQTSMLKEFKRGIEYGVVQSKKRKNMKEKPMSFLTLRKKERERKMPPRTVDQTKSKGKYIYAKRDSQKSLGQANQRAIKKGEKSFSTSRNLGRRKSMEKERKN